MQKAKATNSKKDFWGFLTGVMTTKSAQEAAAADTAEKEAQGIEVTEDPTVYMGKSTESTDTAETQGETTESMGNRRRRLLGVGQEHVGQDLEEPGALEATLAKRSQGTSASLHRPTWCPARKRGPSFLGRDSHLPAVWLPPMLDGVGPPPTVGHLIRLRHSLAVVAGW